MNEHLATVTCTELLVLTRPGLEWVKRSRGRLEAWSTDGAATNEGEMVVVEDESRAG